MKHHTTVSKADQMKALGLSAQDSSTGAAKYHDLDEVMASGKALWKRPWWVSQVNKPTVEVDWKGMERFDATKVQQVSWRKYVGEEEAARLGKLREEKTIEWMLKKKPGYTLRERALVAASAQAGSVAVNFKGACVQSEESRQTDGNIYEQNHKGTKKKDPWAAGALSPKAMGVPRYEGTPDENARMVRAALRHFGADQVGYVELTENNRKLIYDTDALDGKKIVFEPVDQAYETDTKRVIPEKARTVIVFSIQMSEELIKRRSGLAPTALSSTTVGQTYARGRNIIDNLQTFLHVLGYQGLMGTWFNGLGIAPALGVMAGLGELSRLNRLISPEYGPLQRLFKVVTDLPLTPTPPIDAGIMDFCRTCKVCAEKCPSNTLSMETEPFWEPVGPWNNPGHRTWYENSTGCRSWWSTSTVGCITCYAVCPFSKKDKSFMHHFVKASIAKNPIFRKTVNHLFTVMDGVFGYNEPKELESWWDLDLPPYGIDTVRHSTFR